MDTAFRMPRRLGGLLCLDFVNTVGNWGDEAAYQYLQKYTDLVEWNKNVDALTAEEAERLFQAALENPLEAEQAFTEAIRLRNCLHRIFAAIAREQTPDRDDLEILHRIYQGALVQTRLTQVHDHLDWVWEVNKSLQRVIWPALHSAVELLTSAEVSRVKECSNHSGCAWLFFDQSKNGSRRWCAMDECGSRDKMRRQYARKRGQV